MYLYELTLWNTKYLIIIIIELNKFTIVKEYSWEYDWFLSKNGPHDNSTKSGEEKVRQYDEEERSIRIRKKIWISTVRII